MTHDYDDLPSKPEGQISPVITNYLQTNRLFHVAAASGLSFPVGKRCKFEDTEAVKITVLLWIET